MYIDVWMEYSVYVVHDLFLYFFSGDGSGMEKVSFQLG